MMYKRQPIGCGTFIFLVVSIVVGLILTVQEIDRRPGFVVVLWLFFLGPIIIIVMAGLLGK